MTATLVKIKSHFTRWREWELNPIVIKELRQGVRSWTVTGMLLLFLIVLFITSLGFLVTQSFDVNASLGLGATLVSSFMVILAGASIFFIPLYIGVRVAAERQENNPDLLYVSTLSPTRIIFGKFLCGAYIAVLFFSACMPFMAFTNLLRGVDLPTIFFILGFLFLVVCATNMIAIFLACLPMSRPFKFLFVIYGIFQSFGIIASLIGTSFTMMRSGVGTMMASRDFWIGVTTSVGIGVAITGLFFVLTVALISPPSANRALAPRIYITVIWLLGGLLGFRWVLQTGNASRLAVTLAAAADGKAARKPLPGQSGSCRVRPEARHRRLDPFPQPRQALSLNSWMQYRFEVFLGFRVRENSLSKHFSIRGPEPSDNVAIRVAADLRQSACDFVRVDDRKSKFR